VPITIPSVPHPSVSIVFLVYDRREELRESLRRMLFESGYDGEIEAIVVDNASTDGSGAMVREEFPQVRLIERDENIGVPAWNDGVAVAKGDWVLVLDDDAYLLPGDLTRAVDAAVEHRADMVSFSVASTHDPNHLFSDMYRTGLFGFWGCTWLVRREVIQELGGFDPEIFVWANEMEFTMRLLDHGYSHLYYPEVVGQHMKEPLPELRREAPADNYAYRINARHWAYIAARLMRPRHAVGALGARLGQIVRDVIRDGRPVVATLDSLRGFAKGLRRRRPVRPEVSALYRHDCEVFVAPWAMSRPLPELIRRLPVELIRHGPERAAGPEAGRKHEFFDSRPHVYPQTRERRVLSL
jgi:GT2 family glycosyltransferase